MSEPWIEFGNGWAKIHYCRETTEQDRAALTAAFHGVAQAEQEPAIWRTRSRSDGLWMYWNEKPDVSEYIFEIQPLFSKPVVKTIPTWFPITKAPKDKFILLYCPEDQSRWLAKWQGGRWHGVDELGLTREGASLGDPEVVTGWFVSHWRPLPDGPVSSVPSTTCGGENGND